MESTARPNVLQNIANLATILVSVLLSAVLVKVFLLPQKPPAPSGAQPLVGLSIKDSLPGIDWARNKRTLVLALSTQCHYCTGSAPFFQRIQKEASKDVKLVAVLPQPVGDSHQYLEVEGVKVDDVRQVQLNSLGVNGTPTLLLVDEKGAVTQAWEGRLDPNQETQVLAILRREASQ